MAWSQDQEDECGCDCNSTQHMQFWACTVWIKMVTYNEPSNWMHRESLFHGFKAMKNNSTMNLRLIKSLSNLRLQVEKVPRYMNTQQCLTLPGSNISNIAFYQHSCRLVRDKICWKSLKWGREGLKLILTELQSFLLCITWVHWLYDTVQCISNVCD